ncbi:MAG: hypothetical protein WCA85_18480 [Paraburkholderia sp.]|uniref:hypothetical protein n=1 Tax=Paraburkholderia sp. TaxID=1926495 RepID=UPI003C679C57
MSELKLLQKRITPDADRVTLYAVDPTSAAKLRSTLTNFAQHNVSRDFSVAIY